jgi:hypothetical protein
MAEQVDLFDCCSDFMEIILSVSTTAEINHYRVTMDDQLRNRSQSPPVNSSFRNIVSASRPINIQQETSKLIAAAKRQRQANLKLKRRQAFSAITWD